MRPTLIAYEPVQEQGIYAEQYVEDLTAKHERYTHTISAVGGFDQCQFSLKGTREYLETWFEDGLMRRVVYLNPEGVQVFEGFVFGMSYSVGSVQKTKSMENVVNRVYIRFSPLDVTTLQPIGEEPIVLVVNHAESQARWGVKAQIVTGGELTHNEAYAWSHAILNDNPDPKMGENVDLARSSTPNLDLTVKGYKEALNWGPYLNQAVGELPAQQVLAEVLAYYDRAINPGWINISDDWMDWNYRTERRFADEYKTCWQVIEGIIGRGGTGGERWVGGMYQDRTFIYKRAEDFRGLYADYEYYQRLLRDPAHRIFDVANVEVKAWDVVPDRILITVDI